MYSQADHGLTMLGIQQARGLNARWKRWVAEKKSAACKLVLPSKVPSLLHEYDDNGGTPPAVNKESLPMPVDATDPQRPGGCPESKEATGVEDESKLDNDSNTLHEDFVDDFDGADPGDSTHTLESKDEDFYLTKFLQSNRAYSSPLTRATQTALIALQNHPMFTHGDAKLKLTSNIREIKNLGGNDTRGEYIGDDIFKNVEKELLTVIEQGLTDAKPEAMTTAASPQATNANSSVATATSTTTLDSNTAGSASVNAKTTESTSLDTPTTVKCSKVEPDKVPGDAEKVLIEEKTGLEKDETGGEDTADDRTSKKDSEVSVVPVGPEEKQDAGQCASLGSAGPSTGAAAQSSASTTEETSNANKQHKIEASQTITPAVSTTTQTSEETIIPSDPAANDTVAKSNADTLPKAMESEGQQVQVSNLSLDPNVNNITLSTTPGRLDTTDVASSSDSSCPISPLSLNLISSPISPKSVQEIVEGIMRTPHVVGDANHKWWNSLKNSEAEVEERVQDLLNFIRYSESSYPIFVGHSLFFKFLCKRVGKHLKSTSPLYAATMLKHRLNNGALLYVEIDFSESNPVICDAALLLGSSFHPKH